MADVGCAVASAWADLLSQNLSDWNHRVNLVIPFAQTLLIPWLPTWWWYVVLATDIAIVALAVFDFFTMPTPQDIHFSRTMARVASLDKPHPVDLSIDNRGKRMLSLRLSDDASDG